MNWKSILMYLVSAAVAPVLGNYVSATMSGQHIPFTVGTILLPMAASALVALKALFATPPHVTSDALGAYAPDVQPTQQ